MNKEVKQLPFQILEEKFNIYITISKIIDSSYEHIIIFYVQTLHIIIYLSKKNIKACN